MVSATLLLLSSFAITAVIAAPHMLSHSNRQQVGEWASCSVSAGLCIDVNQYSCSGSVVTGQCPGGSNILCCPVPAGVVFGSCASGNNGLCKRTGDCPTSTITGLCPGPVGITCCPGSVSPPTTSPTDVAVTPGIYLEQNPPAQTQFRGRRQSVRPVIVVHTAETSGSPVVPDSRAENTANFIRSRGDFGSYHMLGDLDSIIQLVRFENAAFHDGTGSNEWSIGISLAMRAGDWPGLDANTRNQYVRVMAQMAALAANWFESQGVGKPAARQLTLGESNLSTASGFIAHATRDPGRRSDPGAAFPWTDFLNEYASRV